MNPEDSVMDWQYVAEQLKGLQPQQLQAFGMANRANPFYMALISNEQSRRARIQQQAVAQQPPPQGTVVDKLLASTNTTAENTGIAPLAKDMVFSAAGGGIVAFADGGLKDDAEFDIGDMGNRYMMDVASNEPAVPTKEQINAGVAAALRDKYNKAIQTNDAAAATAAKKQLDALGESVDAPITPVVSSTPAGRWWEGAKQWFAGETPEQQTRAARRSMELKYGTQGAVPGLFQSQSDEERQAAQALETRLPNLTGQQINLIKDAPTAMEAMRLLSAGVPTNYETDEFPGGAVAVPADTGRSNLAAADKSSEGLAAAAADKGVAVPKLTPTSFTPTTFTPSKPFDWAPFEAKQRALIQGERDLAKAQEENIAAQQKELEADQTRFGAFGKQQVARLKKLEDELAGEKTSAEAKGWIDAGLAILAADPSRGALAAIGSGAMKGRQSYEAAVDKIKTRQDKIRDQMWELERIQHQYERADAKERRDLKAKASGIKFDMQKNINVLKKDFSVKQIDVTSAERNIASRENLGLAQIRSSESTAAAQRQSARDIANMQAEVAMATREPAEIQLLKALGEGDLKKGLELKTKITNGKLSIPDAYAKYLTAFAGKTTLEPPMSYVQFAAQFGVLPVVSGDTSGTVRPR